MEKRVLGKNGPDLSEIGLGAWAIGGSWQWGWGEQDDQASKAAIKQALHTGVNWIDTAAVYGLGHGEEIVGQAVRDMRNDVFIATKCGLVWDDRNRIVNNLHPASIRRECENSLRRLGVDHIDLYQIHWPHKNMPVEESWGAMTRLVEEGKVRYIGVSNFDTDLLSRCQAIAPVQSLQPIYNMLQRDAETDILPWCIENEVGVVAYSPLMSGLLTGKFSKDYLATLDETDWRRKGTHPLFRDPGFSRALEFTDALRPIAESYQKTVAQLAIAWTLMHSSMTSSIVGARNKEQAEKNANGAGWSISEDDLAAIDSLYKDIMEDVQSA